MSIIQMDKEINLTCPICMESSLEKFIGYYKCTNKKCADFNLEQNGKRVERWFKHLENYYGDKYECPTCGEVLRELSEMIVSDRIQALSPLMKNAIGRDITIKSSISNRMRGQTRYPDDNEFYCEKCKKYFEKYVVKGISNPIKVEVKI